MDDAVINEDVELVINLRFPHLRVQKRSNFRRTPPMLERPSKNIRKEHKDEEAWKDVPLGLLKDDGRDENFNEVDETSQS